MKKVINGKIYDTDTAKELADWWHSNPFDFNYIHETLYRKRTGEFFLHGEGGPNTKYSVSIDTNSWSGGSRIMPMSFTEAQKWAEEHLSGEKYEEIFGAVTEDESRIQVCYSLSAASVETIKRKASEMGISASAYIDQLVSADK